VEACEPIDQFYGTVSMTIDKTLAIRDEVLRLALAVKGFLSEAEGTRLFELAAAVSWLGPCLEIGTYCGKSTLFLAEGCRIAGRHPVFTVDHHAGSVEQQPGEAYFDADLFEPEEGVVTTLPTFLRNVRSAGLKDWIVPIIGDSRRLARYWPTGDLGLLFIDGGHSEEDAFADYYGWSRRVLPGGYLCIHDVFADPADGGQAPFRVFEHAQSSGLWEYVEQVESLGVLRRRAAEAPAYSVAAFGNGSNEPETHVSVEFARYLGAPTAIRGSTWVIVGQDGGQSISLGDATLFVFSDMLVAERPVHEAAPIAPTYAALDHQRTILANAAAVSSGSDMRTTLATLQYFVDSAGKPREILPATPAEQAAGVRFWPQHGILIDRMVYLFYLGIHMVDRHSAWGFRTLGSGLAILDPANGTATRVLRNGEWCLWPVRGDDFHVGVQVLRQRDDIYVFGSGRTGVNNEAWLAQVPVTRIADPDAYKFLSASAATPTWGPGLDQAQSLGPCGAEYSVSYNAYLGHYVMLYVDGFEKNLKVRVSEHVWGPYSRPRKLIGVPYLPTTELVYLGFEHPRFSERNGQVLYVSYCQPRFSPISLVKLRLH
jgi:MMP 1-O-methyltransferase